MLALLLSASRALAELDPNALEAIARTAAEVRVSRSDLTDPEMMNAFCNFSVQVQAARKAVAICERACGNRHTGVTSWER